MFRRVGAVALSVVGAALASAAAAEARVVSIPSGDFGTTDALEVVVRPRSAPPVGWHYELALLMDNADEDDEGCAYYDSVNSFFGRRPFSVEYSPEAAALTSGAAEWCLGTGRVVLFRQKNRTTSDRYLRIVAKSRQFVVVPSDY
ncbi:hypothetical protein [Patulibacter sp. SYSU D01012]|uniref:hypothetical protein n=1 Tax=Patulibacter sp. SYSU D01012 TaxID=2817381 RepID=UPI001B30307C|nr:hypothetical protein [Patulibacter sp. SYSU D01012]